MILKNLFGANDVKDSIKELLEALNRSSIQKEIEILQTQKLSKEEIKATLIRKGYKDATIEAAMASGTNASANTAEATAESASAAATNADTVAKKENAKAAVEATAASGVNTAANTVEAASETANAVATDVDTASKTANTAATNADTVAKNANTAAIYANIKAMLKWLVTTPQGLITLAAVSAAIKAAFLIYNNSVDGMIKKNQKLIDSNKEVYDSILKEQKTLSNNADNLKEEYENYLTATKGSEEYYNAVNKIAELSPELVIGYDTEGNAILANNDAIKAQIEYYRQLAKEKQNAARQEAMENLDEEAESYKKLASKKESKEEQYNKSKETLDKYEKIIKDAESGKMLSEQDIALYNEAITSIDGIRGRTNDLREDLSALSDQLLTSGNSLRTYYTALFDTVEGELTEGQKSLRQGLVNTAMEEGWSAEKFQTMDDFIDKGYVKNAAEEIINLDDNLSEEEYRSQAIAIYEKLVKQFILTDEQQQAFKVAFGIDDETIQNSNTQSLIRPVPTIPNLIIIFLCISQTSNLIVLFLNMGL